MDENEYKRMKQNGKDNSGILSFGVSWLIRNNDMPAFIN